MNVFPNTTLAAYSNNRMYSYADEGDNVVMAGTTIYHKRDFIEERLDKHCLIGYKDGHKVYDNECFE